MLIVILVSALLMPLNEWLASMKDDPFGPEVGDHLHSLTYADGTLLVAGHEATARRSETEWDLVDALQKQHTSAVASIAAQMLVLTEGQAMVGDPMGDVEPVASRLPAIAALGATGDDVYAFTSEGELLRSTDGALLFVAVRGATPELRGNIAVDPRDPDRAYGIDEGGSLVATTDGGSTWREVPSPGETTSVAVESTGESTLAVLTDSGIHLSADDGLTWQNTNAPDKIEGLTFDESGSLTAGTTVDKRVVAFTFRDGVWTALV